MSTTPEQSPHSGSTPSLGLEKSVELEARDDEEEEEELTGVDEPTQKFSYRKFGVAFLLLAIVVAIILASVPAAVNTSDKLNTLQTGYLFFTLLAVFLILLLSCLFCTYYLGGSRDTWEDPVFTGIRFNFSNTTAIIGLFVEFIQVCGFSFHEDAKFTGSNRFINMLYAAVPYKPGSVFNVVYWVMFVLAFSPYIFVVSVRMIIYTINHQKGETEAALFVQNYQQKIYSILWFLVNTIYLPVISTMMGGLDCTFKEDKPSFDSEPIACFTRKQLGFMIASLIALVIYYPAASFAQAQTQNISDIKFKPKIVFIFVQGKVVLAGMFVFFGAQHSTAYLTVVFVTDLVFLILNIWAKPCLVQWVNQMRTIFFAVSAWTTLCSIISLSHHINRNTPLALLVVGWFVAIVGLPILFFIKYKFGDAIMGTIFGKRSVSSQPASPASVSPPV
eukprot:Phypoly_transcript_06671.p1 GENE.Phypoly_transcript_06671~~Phypoly_transcript_06671.p1  ORF type:complete len:446 (+),score=62.83 Phypoly_transcript_06671:134-1471(+)